MDIENKNNQSNEGNAQPQADNGQQQMANEIQAQNPSTETAAAAAGEAQRADALQQAAAQHSLQVIPDNFSQIFDDFRIAIKNGLSQKVADLLRIHSKLDLANKLDPQTRQISLFTAVLLPDEDVAYQMFKVLLEGDANPQFVDHLKQNIVYYLAREGKARILEMMLRDYKVEADPRDNNGQSPIFYAASANQVETIKVLVKYGADVKAQDTLLAQTALYYAAREGNTEVCRFLLDNGCSALHQDLQKKQAIVYARKYNKKETTELLNQYMQKEKDQLKAKQQKASSMEEENKNLKPKKNRHQKDSSKIAYKLIFTNEKGESNELTVEEFEQFKTKYPEAASFILNADDKVDDEMVAKAIQKESWDKIAKRILNTTSKSKNAYLFLAPVDTKKFNIPDYHDIVKKPMDFGTIKSKLNQNVYNNMQEFIEDVELVFYNCRIYNGAESEVGIMGNAVREEFLNLLKQAGLSLKNNEHMNNHSHLDQSIDESSHAQDTHAQQLSSELQITQAQNIERKPDKQVESDRKKSTEIKVEEQVRSTATAAPQHQEVEQQQVQNQAAPTQPQQQTQQGAEQQPQQENQQQQSEIQPEQQKSDQIEQQPSHNQADAAAMVDENQQTRETIKLEEKIEEEEQTLTKERHDGGDEAAAGEATKQEEITVERERLPDEPVQEAPQGEANQ